MLGVDIEAQEGIFWALRFTPELACESSNHSAGEPHADGGPLWWMAGSCPCPEYIGYRCDAYREYIHRLHDKAESQGVAVVCERGHYINRCQFILIRA